jgi:hypothetical protein
MTQRQRRTSQETPGETRRLEGLLAGVFCRRSARWLFDDLAAEFDAFATGKKLSFATHSTRDLPTALEEYSALADERGLEVHVVPEDRGGWHTIFVCRAADRWRIQAVKEVLELQLRVNGVVWCDNLERLLSRLLGYEQHQIDAWIRQNYLRTGFWTGVRRTFVCLSPQSSDLESLALRRAFTPQMSHWWAVAIPHEWGLRTRPRLSSKALVVRAALDEDPLSDSFARGETVTFPGLGGMRARRLLPVGDALNAVLRAKLDVVEAVAPPRSGSRK